MPPIPQQQTSRGGLITALVVSIMFAVGFLVWAIMNNAELTKKEQAYDTQKKAYEKVIAASSLGSVSDLQSQFGAEGQRPLIDAATEQRKRLSTLISGDAEGNEKAVQASVNAVMQGIANNPALKGAAIPTSPLTNVIETLAKKAQDDAAAVEKAKADVAAAQKALQDATAAFDAASKQKDQAVAAAQAAQMKSETDAKAAIDEKQKQVDAFSQQVAEAQKQLADAQAQATVEIQTRDRNYAKLKQDYDAVVSRLAQFRPDTKESVVRNVDATITNVAPDSICYVNLGYGDHVNTGLTFEIYDKVDGVPRLNPGQSALDMPKGKASIEIINVGQNSSQCRITRTTQGQTVSQGDLCVNVAYDRNIKPVFYVYGKFDMDNNGVATEQEAEVVKNLITRWGGKVADRISIDVDFCVMGKEPTIPVYTPEELQQPIPRAKSDEAKAALDAFNKVLDEAVGKHIPVLNQTRFLYMTGYFDMAKR